MKNISVFIIAGLYINSKQLKPFTPRLGSTLEGRFEDGTNIYMENTSYNPPVCHFFIEDKDKGYILHGGCHFKMKVLANGFIQQTEGKMNI